MAAWWACVHRVRPTRQQFHGLPDAARLVNAALLADGQRA
jgi:hypothetical protein